MDSDTNRRPEPESIRLAMDQAWRDHHHARDQTWKALQMVVVLGAGLVTIDFKFTSLIATFSSALLVYLASYTGIEITLNHRKLERRKFIHIMNCEDWLGLHRDELIPFDPDDGSIGQKAEKVRDSAVKIPQMITKYDIINFAKQNTSLFLLRMHIAVIGFSTIIVLSRLIFTIKSVVYP